MNNTLVKKQYNDFHQTYSQKLDVQNEVSNTLYYKSLDFELNGKTVLDIGCGDGTDLKQLSSKGAIVYGIDPSEEFIKKAQINNPPGTFVNGVGESLPFEDNAFDIVVSKWAIQTSTNVPGILSEAARVLKPGGKLLYLTKHPWMQWLEKVRDYGHGVDYYEQKIVTSNIYDGAIQLKEPSHTLGEYLNKDFFDQFELIDYQEATEFPASEQINGDVYPTFFIIKARKK